MSSMSSNICEAGGARHRSESADEKDRLGGQKCKKSVHQKMCGVGIVVIRFLLIRRPDCFLCELVMLREWWQLKGEM